MFFLCGILNDTIYKPDVFSNKSAFYEPCLIVADKFGKNLLDSICKSFCSNLVVSIKETYRTPKNKVRVQVQSSASFLGMSLMTQRLCVMERQPDSKA